MIADTLSDAVDGIDYYLKNDAFEPETLDEILRVRSEMENLRIALDRASFAGCEEFLRPTNPEVEAVEAAFTVIAEVNNGFTGESYTISAGKEG